MNKTFLPVLLVLALSACGTTDGTHATLDDRTGGVADGAAVTTSTAGTSDQAGSKAGGAGIEGAQTSALDGAGVKGSSLDGSALGSGQAGSYTGDPRKNPASPLSTRSIFFDFDQFVVKPEFSPVVEAHAGYLLSKRDARVILQGNTDERGSREYNLALGQKRAEAVRKALAVLGVSEEQMEAVSFGEEKLRNEGDTDEAHAENRRTDVVYTDE
ncbi:MAG: peptidoglycan-associated lipoprotein Pal [Thiobacillus sp.]